MNIQLNKTLSIAASLLVTLVAGAPAIADDTELLVVDPGNTVATPPNIMFILDTSGSMGDPVDTTKPYDNTLTYTGSCAADKFYWTTLDIEPSCVGGTNTQFVNEAAFVCADATLRMSGIGAYAGVMVQYRADATSSQRWQQLEIGNATGLVECQNDDSVHGNGTTGDYYAQAGTDLRPIHIGPECGFDVGQRRRDPGLYHLRR